jgi:riboflavin biosynthesis pyrimidine reductase
MTVTITNVMAISLDGMIGKHALESDIERRAYDFTNLDDREFVREQLKQADAVITGANSLRASGATWQVLNDRGVNPAWIVFTTRGLEEGLEFWGQRSVRRILVSPVPVNEALCVRYGVENWVYPENTASRVVERLGSECLHRVLLFGGGSINKIFYENNFVDFAKITVCPLIISGVKSPRFVDLGLPHPVHLTCISSVLKGDLVFLTYKVKKQASVDVKFF